MVLNFRTPTTLYVKKRNKGSIVFLISFGTTVLSFKSAKQIRTHGVRNLVHAPELQIIVNGILPAFVFETLSLLGSLASMDVHLSF